MHSIICKESNVNKKIASVIDYKSVADTVSRYVEAIRTGNIDMLDDVFHKAAVTYGIVEGHLMGGISNPAVDFIKMNGESPELDSHIDVLDMTSTTAVVRLITEKDAIGTDCCEYLTLIKFDTGWAIISKVFLQFDK